MFVTRRFDPKRLKFLGVRAGDDTSPSYDGPKIRDETVIVDPLEPEENEKDVESKE